MSHESLPCPAKGLELVLYAGADLSPPEGPAFQLNLNTGERLEHHLALAAEEDPRFWFVIDLSIARDHGVALVGPPAEAVLPELPRELVLAALGEALDWYESAGASAETILSACRGWAWAQEGVWRSKAAAADWARPRLSDPGPVDRALAARERSGAAPSKDDIQAVLEPARAAIATQAPRTSGQ